MQIYEKKLKKQRIEKIIFRYKTKIKAFFHHLTPNACNITPRYDQYHQEIHSVSPRDTTRITALNFSKSKVDFQKTLFTNFLCFKKIKYFQEIMPEKGSLLFQYLDTYIEQLRETCFKLYSIR